ncbi:MAG: protein kinase [Acidobacteriota bacterium]
MNPERWQQVDKLLEQALEQEPDRRGVFLDQACNGDAALRQEVELLLSAHEKAEGFSEMGPMWTLENRVEEVRNLTGRQIGHYQILSRLGEGGMGVVYKARDTLLARTVALKVLSSELVNDPEHKRRFVQEAKAVSSLNHPNIVTIYDVATDQGADVIVMEFVAGQTLGELIPRRGLKLSDALKYAVQMADGLAKAHGAGIIHRDMKPGNVMVSEEGLVKLLDFGLAKLTERPQLGERLSTSSLQPQTEEGMILGTVSYMSPEQADGRLVDARSDIFSFGSVLYEMVTGQRAFQGDSKMSTLAAILNQEPKPAGEIAPALPYDLERIITRCLRKDPSRRFQHMGDVKIDLDELRQAASDPALDSLRQTQHPRADRLESSLKRIKRRNLLAWIIAGISLLTAIPFAVEYFRHSPADLQRVKLSVLLPKERGECYAISPDGNQLGYTATTGDRSQLWVRPLDSLSARPLAGTEGALDLFWSPDGRQIGFFTKDKLKRITLSSGAVTPLCNVAGLTTKGGTWGDGEIVFNPGTSRLHRISASGGEPTPVTTLDQSRGERTHAWPWFLPDGRHFLYYVSSSQPDHQGIHVGSLDSTERRRLVGAMGAAAYAPPGYLLFVLNQMLVAQPFDPDRLQITGELLSVGEQVEQTAGYLARFSVSATNVLTFWRPSNVNLQLVWFDRAGRQLQSVPAPGNYEIYRLSLDGMRLAGNRIDPETGHNDIWLLELSRGTPTPRRVTADASYQDRPVWSPDGTRLVFSSGRGELYLKNLSSPEEGHALLKSETIKHPQDWSLDGRFILYTNLDSKVGQQDLWFIPLFGDRQPAPFLTTPFEEKQGQFSPDGRWVAYCSDESGKDEVYVQSFPVAGNKVLISTSGGTEPRWRRDGKELFYLAADGRLMAVEILKAGPTLTAGIPKALPVKTRRRARASYAVTGDGQRFLIYTATDEPPIIDVVLNWTRGLREQR